MMAKGVKQYDELNAKLAKKCFELLKQGKFTQVEELSKKLPKNWQDSVMQTLASKFAEAGEFKKALEIATNLGELERTWALIDISKELANRNKIDDALNTLQMISPVGEVFKIHQLVDIARICASNSSLIGKLDNVVKEVEHITNSEYTEKYYDSLSYELEKITVLSDISKIYYDADSKQKSEKYEKEAVRRFWKLMENYKEKEQKFVDDYFTYVEKILRNLRRMGYQDDFEKMLNIINDEDKKAIFLKEDKMMEIGVEKEIEEVDVLLKKAVEEMDKDARDAAGLFWTAFRKIATAYAKKFYYPDRRWGEVYEDTLKTSFYDDICVEHGDSLGCELRELYINAKLHLYMDCHIDNICVKEAINEIVRKIVDIHQKVREKLGEESSSVV